MWWSLPARNWRDRAKIRTKPILETRVSSWKETPLNHSSGFYLSLSLCLWPKGSKDTKRSTESQSHMWLSAGLKPGVCPIKSRRGILNGASLRSFRLRPMFIMPSVARLLMGQTLIFYKFISFLVINIPSSGFPCLLKNEQSEGHGKSTFTWRNIDDEELERDKLVKDWFP